MEYTLRPARTNDLETVLPWVPTPELLRLWGGPALPFPPRADQLWREIGATDQNAFSLVDVQGNVVGFGQALFRSPATVHLGRIIVSPSQRGKGLGRILCQQLIGEGSARHHPTMFTLNVYRNNLPAYNLYLSLGFVVLSEDAEQDSFHMGLMS